MARDLGEQERAFIDALAADTGRDLTGWMDAIAASGHQRRNDIIDWLRHQGFTFSNASWLERIHHNGGRLIYGLGEGKPAPVHAAPAESAAPAAGDSVPQDQPAPPPTAPVSAGTPEQSADVPVPAPPPPAAAPPPPPPPRTPAAADEPAAAEVTALLSSAKGLRPLAEFVLREMDVIVPALVRRPAPPFLTLSSPMPFAALLPGPKELRLFADFGPQTRDRTRKADTGRLAAPFPDVLVLTDARQVDERFRDLIGQAYTRALR